MSMKIPTKVKKPTVTTFEHITHHEVFNGIKSILEMIMKAQEMGATPKVLLAESHVVVEMNGTEIFKTKFTVHKTN